MLTDAALVVASNAVDGVVNYMQAHSGARGASGITVTTETDFDPAAATVEVSVDGTWHPATWTETATYTPPGTWDPPRTDHRGYFAGPDATANGATVLAAGSHATQARITSGGDVVVAPSSVIEVG